MSDDATTKGAPGGATVYYDGECPICRVEIGAMRRLDRDGRVRFEDIAADPGLAPPEVGHEAAMRRFHMRTGDGSLKDGAAGFAALWAELPPLRPLARFARVPGVLAVLERLYRGFLIVRPGMQRLARRLGAR